MESQELPIAYTTSQPERANESGDGLNNERGKKELMHQGML